jgi:hypothetical protein
MAKASKSLGPIVRVSVPLDSRNHARLCALAALRSAERSAVAAEILTAGLKDVVVIDPRSKEDRGKINDRQGMVSDVDNSGADAA